LGSDENDWTYDCLGLDVMDRGSGVKLNDASKKTIAFEDPEIAGALGEVGVVVWLVKSGALLPVVALEATVKELEAEDPEQKGYGKDAEERKQEIDKEVALLKRAIEAGGQVDATGTNGIFSKIEERR